MVGIQYLFCNSLATHITVVVRLQRIVLNMNEKKGAIIGTHLPAYDKIEKENEI